MNLSFAVATDADAAALAALRTAVAERLTREHGKGHWSSGVTEGGVLGGIRTSRVLLARDGDAIVGTLRLATKKPWAIDTAYFTQAKKALYLTDMAVSPDRQRQGIGRELMQSAAEHARRWPGDAIRLDAYDAPAGAGGFYAKCGLREVGRTTYRRVPLIYFEWLL
jgi:GNAT superfamily N-acetyltransferase